MHELTSWPQIRLGELAEFRNGLNYTDADVGKGLAIVGVTDFRDHVIANLSTLQEIGLSALPKDTAMVLKNDILFVRSNGNRELIGRSLFVKHEPQMPTSHSGFTIRCRFLSSMCHPRFYAYLFRGPIVRSTLSAQGGGTNISNLNQGILSDLMVPVPPMLEQVRIASILSAYDDLIENNTRRIAVLEEMALRIFEEWFVHFRAPGCENLPRINTPVGPVAEGWSTARLEELASDIRDAILPSEIDPTTPYVGLEHIPRRSITLKEWGTAEDVGSLKLAFKPGDYLFGKIRPYFHKAAMAPIDGISSSDAIIIRAKRQEWRGVVGCVVSSDAFVAHAVKTSNGTKMPRADWKVLRNFSVALPPDALLARFNETVLPSLALASNLAMQNRNLRAQRDLLLPRLISGEIDVSSAPALLEAAE